jgi:hypothetical protein
MEQKEKLFEFKKLGDKDGIPYTKVDMAKVCRLNKTFAISFYQVDYQALANFLMHISSVTEDQIKEIPVSKVAMDLETFENLLNQMNEIQTKIRQEKKI